MVIVGGGLAGVRTAQSLRSAGFADPVRIVAGERHLPYDRPPLSKELLTGSVQESDIRLLPAEGYHSLDIELMLNAQASGVDLERRRVQLADGATIDFDHLVVATGARPRRLAVLEPLRRAIALRTLGDSLQLRSTLRPETELVVVGAGFIGLEVAAAAVERGCKVTIVEARPQPLAAALGEQLGEVVADWHRSHGVRLLCGRAVTAADELSPTAAARLVLDDGTRLQADAVVCAVGVEPEVAWLAGTPLCADDGVPCGQDGRTAIAGVYAAGDVAQPSVGDRRIAIGHWTPAADLARRVSISILGGEHDASDLDDYFWSDQFGARLQLAGSIDASGELSIDEGAIEDWSFLASCHVGATLTGIFAMNRPRDFVRARLAMQRAAA